MSGSDDKINNMNDGEAGGGGVKKFGFSLTANKKGSKKRGATTASSSSSTAAAAAALAFDDPDDDDLRNEDDINPDIPKKPLVIPLQQDKRKSLQEQARSRRQKELNGVQQQQQQQPDVARSNDDPKNINDNDNSKIIVKNEQSSNIKSNNDMSMSEEDRAAIQALQREASAAQGTGGDDDDRNGNNKRVIASSSNTFQHNNRDDDQKQFENDIEQLPPDISVESQVYKAVPISEFGAAMLRGMGWSGGNDNGKNKKNNDPTTMPRPSRLGLGATPKMNASGDAPDTHARRRPRRQDQVQREERLRRQQEDMERERQKQFAMDKQRVLQIGSIVFVVVSDNAETRKRQRRRAVIKKLTGVPGLNMILIKYEGEATTTKVKKGNIELVERSDLEEKPFQEVDEQIEKMKDNDKELLVKREDSDQRYRDRRHRDEGRYERNDRNKNSDDRRRDKKSEYDERDRDRDCESDRHKRRRDDDKRRDDEKRHKKSSRDNPSSSRRKESNHHNSNSLAITTSWLIPNIRVRVISSKYGGSVYKEKGVVVDVTRKGVATLKMSNGQVINVAERHLETALPKAGGNSIILSGDQRHSKGRLLERDSKKNRGVVQVFEDMSVITTSLDDMAEWCGPLDDDLEN
jgi:hypothetical protein